VNLIETLTADSGHMWFW